MSTDGIEAIYLTTHNWGRAAKFFLALGYEMEFETGHNSGQLRNRTGPSVFIAEIPEEQETSTRVVMRVPDADVLGQCLPEALTELLDTIGGRAKAPRGRRAKKKGR